jgi:hypothetical protein
VKSRSQLLNSIANTIADYRADAIETPTGGHVEAWIEQFDANIQNEMLAELDYVLERTYISKSEVEKFLSSLAKNKKITGGDHSSFWKRVNFLNIQKGGNSQHEMIKMFDKVLKKEFGLGIAAREDSPEEFIYLDDGIFTGNRILNDIRKWMKASPQKAAVHVVVIALHRGGHYYARTKIQEEAMDAGKQLNLDWWRCVEIEDRRSEINTSDVLRPTSLPDDHLTNEYVGSLKYKPILRRPGNVGENEFFSSEMGRNLLEQELLKAGIRIRSECPLLNTYQRPLGNMVLETLGFGSLMVTYRNCPNNCPLAFWAGDPWYPLFPRKTN